MTNRQGLHGDNPVKSASSSPGQTLLDRVEYSKKLWIAAFQGHGLPAPDDSYFIKMLSKFSVAEFEYAVGRTARKFPVRRPARPPFVTLDTLAGYVIGVLNSQRKNRA